MPGGNTCVRFGVNDQYRTKGQEVKTEARQNSICYRNHFRNTSSFSNRNVFEQWNSVCNGPAIFILFVIRYPHAGNRIDFVLQIWSLEPGFVPFCKEYYVA